MRFIYQAKNSPDQIFEGIIEAESFSNAETTLIKKGLFPISIKEEFKNKINFSLFNHISLRDINIFTQQLSNLISAGMPLLKTLDTIYGQTNNYKFKAVLNDIKEKVKKGCNFSDALGEYKDIFNNYYIGLIRAGESAGALDKVCVSLADFTESQEDFRSKVWVSLSYPALIFIVGCLTLYVLFAFIIPKLSFIFLNLADSLPLPTKILLSFSNFLKTKSWLLIFIFAAGFYMFRKYLKTVNGRFKFDKLVLDVPVIGNFIKKNQMAIFIKTLALLITYGIPITEALLTASQTIKNKLLFEKVNELRLDVLGGASFKGSLEGKDYLEPFAINLISSAEESGSLEFALNKISDIYSRDIERNIKIVTSILEPVMILIIGVVVGLIVIAILLPIFQMNLLIK